MSRMRRLLLGHTEVLRKPRPAIKNQVYTILRIWRNYSHDDIGLERLLRLALACAQFLTPGLYIKQISGQWGYQWRNITTEIYVFLKCLFPLVAMNAGWFKSAAVVWLSAYLVTETLIYLAVMMFVSDATRERISPRRSVLLLFLNFFEIMMSFALLFLHFSHRLPGFFKPDIYTVTDAVYFSFVTAATVGFGDVVPVAPLAKHLVMLQITITFVFVGLFLNFFSNLFSRAAPVQTRYQTRKSSHRKN
jgi:Ion channel